MAPPTSPIPGSLVVRGASLLGDEHRGPLDVVVTGGRIAAIGSTPANETDTGTDVVDGAGLFVAPGFLDLQCNGAVGIDLAVEPERLWEVAAALPRWGVTAWLPTIITSPPEVTERALATLAAGPPPQSEPVAWPLGLHLEGPFLADARKGAHPARHLRLPDRARAATWSRDAGVALVTLAPELPGALDLVDDLVGRGVVVSLGHSTATAAEACAAVERGASMVTHLFNAMEPLQHRAPTLVAQALADERLSSGVIADGLHIDPTVVVAAWRALGPRLVLVTDAVGALGIPPGERRLGDGIGVVTVGPDGVRLADGTLAGSNLSMDAAVRNLAAWTGCGLAGAVDAATASPAAVLGVGDRGALRTGAVADLVLMTADGEVVTTVAAGRVSPGSCRSPAPAGADRATPRSPRPARRRAGP